ncbi:MAG TPA: hypothetical protein VG944_24530, partial [Fimbriimonas sp.]|nr:hypothetical protein [Fimbriimonas sp.]
MKNHLSKAVIFGSSLVAFSGFGTVAQAQTSEWTQSFDPDPILLHSIPNGMVHDASHYYVVVGCSGPPGAPLFASRNVTRRLLPSDDFYLYKYSASGTLQSSWRLADEDTTDLPMGAGSIDYQFYKPVGIVTDGAGNFYTGGSYNCRTFQIPGWGEACCFLIKFTSAGFSSATVYYPPNGQGYTAAAILYGGDGNVYLTGSKIVSGVSHMVVEKFSPNSGLGGSEIMVGGNNTNGTCLTWYGGSTGTLIVGGSDTSNYALWTNSNEKTYAINSIDGDTINSVVVNSSGQVYATGLSQHLVTGSPNADDTTTVRSTLSGSDLGTIHLVQTITGVHGDAGGIKVVIDPSSSDGKPIVECTNTVSGSQNLRVLKYTTTGTSPVWTQNVVRPTSGSGGSTILYQSSALSMESSVDNEHLYVTGTLQSYTGSGPWIPQFLISNLLLDDGGLDDGSYVWTANSGIYASLPSGATGLTPSAMTVLRDGSSVDHIAISGGGTDTS